MKGEGNQQDYGMRVYDGRLGRFLSVDPLTKEYPWYTPYSFAGNKPITFIDRDGEEEGLDISMKRIERAYLNNEISGTEARDRIHMVSTGGVVGTAISADMFLFKGKVTQYIAYTQFAAAFEHNRAKTPEGRAAQDQRSKEAITDAAIGWAAGKIFKNVGELLRDSYTISKAARLKIFASKLEKAVPASNQKEAINLINKTLDEVEEVHSGIKKAKGIPDRDDGRMYGILDEKYVTTLEDGTKIANTKGNRIILEKDGGFKIQTKDGSKTLIEKAGKKEP